MMLWQFRLHLFNWLVIHYANVVCSFGLLSRVTMAVRRERYRDADGCGWRVGGEGGGGGGGGED